MMNDMGEPTVLALMGLLGGMVLGLAARLGRFCTLGAIEDALYAQDDTRLRMWGIAIGTAITGSFALAATGLLCTVIVRRHVQAEVGAARKCAGHLRRGARRDDEVRALLQHQLKAGRSASRGRGMQRARFCTDHVPH